MIVTARPAGAQTVVCDQEPHFAGDLAASGYNPPPPTHIGYFASDIGIDKSGDRAIVGEFGGNGFGLGPGLARVYTRSGGQWHETASLGLGQSGESEDEFGASVDISGNFAIISAPGNPDAVYFFRYDGSASEWHLHTEIINPGAPGDDFGGPNDRPGQVAIDGRTAAVTAMRAQVGSEQSAGVVYVLRYSLSEDEWIIEDTLTAPTPVANGFFGSGVEISSGRLIVGASAAEPAQHYGPGRAFVFRRDLSCVSDCWSFEAELNPSLWHTGDRFGWSVSIDGNDALVGAPRLDQTGTTPGGAFVFRFSSLTESWEEQAMLGPENGQDEQRFGIHVSINGPLALVGAFRYVPPDVGENVGTAYLFQRQPGPVWDEAVQFLAVDGEQGDLVGYTLALRGDEAFVGATAMNIIDTTNCGDPPLPPCSYNEGSLMIFRGLPGCE